MNKIKPLIAGSLILMTVIITGGCTTPMRGVQNGELWHHDNKLVEEDYPSIVLPEDRDFKILLLADLQLESLPSKDKKALKTIRIMTEKTDPDLILTLGDNTSGKNEHKLIPKLIKAFEELEKPWSVSLGNHDAEGKGDRYWLGNLYENARNSLFRMGPSNIHGVGNSAIRLVNNQGELRKLLVLMDSNSNRYYPEGITFDYIYYDQIQWYRWLIEGFGRTPSLAFFHIPLIEFKEAVKDYDEGRISPDLVFGEVKEGVCSPLVNTGLFDVMKELGSTTHIFNGHDHINNISILYDGIRMTYVQKTGPGSYFDEDMQGGTLLTISPEGEVKTINHIPVD